VVKYVGTDSLKLLKDNWFIFLSGTHIKLALIYTLQSMKITYALTALILFFLISCKTDEDDSTLSIKGITYMSESGWPGDIDSDDWRLNDEFTSREKQLFDTLDFTKRATAEPMTYPDNTIYSSTSTMFAPNPVSTNGYLLYYHTNHILNIVIVDNKYHKLLSNRSYDKQQLTFNFIPFNKGIYRMYYVIQDAQYNIVYLGHGDIEKE